MPGPSAGASDAGALDAGTTALLDAHRDRANARFAQARLGRPWLDGGAFLEVVRELVVPRVAVAVRDRGEAAPRILDALYDVALELFAADRLGPRSRVPAIDEAWRTLLPLADAWLAEDPRGLAGAITNAVDHVAGASTGRPQAWVATMAEVRPHAADAAPWLEAGHVAAWRAGLVVARASALRTARGLAEPVARAALGIPDGPRPLGEVLDGLERDRFATPASVGAPAGLRVVARIGAHVAFGGAFASPPRVAVRGGRWVAFDGTVGFHLEADAFGASLRRRPEGPSDPSRATPSPYRYAPDGTVTADGERRRFEPLARAGSIAATANGLAIAIPCSHAIYVVACTSGSGLA